MRTEERIRLAYLIKRHMEKDWDNLNELQKALFNYMNEIEFWEKAPNDILLAMENNIRDSKVSKPHMCLIREKF